MTKTIPYLESIRDGGRLCFAEATRAANRAITCFYNERLADADINVGQLSLLMRLYFRPGMPLNQLARNMRTDRTTLSRNLRVLERSGHLRMSAAEDRRKRVAGLTEQGLASLELALPLWQSAQQELREKLGRQDWEALFEGLDGLARLPVRETGSA